MGVGKVDINNRNIVMFYNAFKACFKNFLNSLFLLTSIERFQGIAMFL